MSALGVHGQTGDRVDMAAHRVQTLGARLAHVPHFDVIVDATRHELVLGGAKARAQDLEFGVLECDGAAGRRALATVPHSEREVVAARAEHVRRVT